MQLFKNIQNVSINQFIFLVKDGQISIVKGTYTFYHYGQGGFNDHQWGCAYRSLQTLYSWFKYVLHIQIFYEKFSLLVITFWLLILYFI